MKVQRNNGFVSTITFINYLDTDKESRLRDLIFSNASSACGFTPKHRLDVYDETILIFESSLSAISFLISLFRSAIDENIAANKLNLRAGLCSGDFFIHQDQIYGDAVNFATKLSYSSRQNEILVCGIDQDTVENFTGQQNDVCYATRSQEENCFSISLIDEDPTIATINNLIFKVKYNNKKQDLSLSRYKKISIGRSNKADVFIDDDSISRNHATITFNNEKISIEDHSSNGTYVYIDGEEKYVTNDSVILAGQGYILCGKRRQEGNSNPTNSDNIISFQLRRENTRTVF